MKRKRIYSHKVYLTVEHIDGEDFDHWIFSSFANALEWLKDYPIQTHNWTLSSEPIGLPESEYSKWEYE